MSTTFRVYVGPFAEWLLPANKKSDATSRRATALVDEFDSSPNGSVSFVFDESPVILIRGKRYVRECWIAFLGDAPAKTFPRKLSWAGYGGDNMGIWERSGFPIKAEIRWFKKHFAAQLEQLTAVYGFEPEIKWGVVANCS